MNEQTTAKYLALGKRLYEKTVKGDVRWQETADEQAVIVFFENAALSLRAADDANIEVVVRSRIGEPLDNLSVSPPDAELWEVFSKLYAAAAREVTRVIDSTLEKLIDEVDSAQVVGRKPLAERLGLAL
jgi:hypothetical protein